MENLKRLNTGVSVQKDEAQTVSPKLLRIGLIVSLIVIGFMLAGAAYVWFSGGNGQASAAVTAPSLVLEPGDTRSLYSIAPHQAEARFIIQETLVGNPKTVIGSTHEVAGEMLIDLDNPQNSVLGVIRVNVRTLETDNEFRNRALRGQILQADRPEFEFAEFTPTSLSGLPESVTVGEAFTFQIMGSLRVHGVSRDVTFDATVTPVSHTRIEGTVRTSIMYRDFGMNIPAAAGVANVSDDVRIEIDFAAQTTSE